MRPRLPYAVTAAVILTAPALTAAPIITEFLTNNNIGIFDEDIIRQDWIEIHNPDLVDADLSGYHLTDDALLPTRWTFPVGVTIAPGGYLVVFASSKNRTVAGAPLHTNFSLSSAGEDLQLNAPGGTPVVSGWAPYPVQSGDVSYGLLAATAGAGSAFFTTPTPGALNNSAGAPAESVVFTPPSKAFNNGTTQNVALSVTSPTAVVRFTTNRSLPIGVAGITGSYTADAATDVCTMTAHGLSQNDMVRVSGPAPLVASVNYFVAVLSANTFKLAIEPGGPPIDLTAGGTHTLRRDAFAATAATTDVFTTPVANTFFGGDPVQVSTTGTLPGGVVAGTTYYVVFSSTSSFRLSASPALTPILDITTAGTGIHTVFRTPSPAYTTRIPVTINTRVRARAFEAGRPPGPPISEMYFAIDANAQNFTSPLPIVLTHTWNTPMSSDVVVPGHVLIFEPKATDDLARLTNLPDLASPCALERRGSSTAGDPKYSMACEMQDEFGIDQNRSPLGLPGESDWIMHAPYNFDRSLMHNDLIYRMSNDIGRYAVRTKFIEHFHNVQSATNTVEGTTATGAAPSGDYFGVYSFMEKITRGNNRVDVENLTIADNAAPAVQGGYMFKVDRLDAGEGGITPLAGQSFGPVNQMGYVNPREVSLDPFKRITTAQSTYLRGHIGEAWSVLNNLSLFMDPVNGYAKYFDAHAAVDHQLLNIMTKNADANRLSAYWHKPRFGKITAGPIWDFDRAEGSTDGRDFRWDTWRGDVGDLGTDFFHYPWFNEMFKDPNFWQLFIDRYHLWRQGPWSTASVHARIDEFVAQVNPGDTTTTPAKRNIARWGQTPRGAGSNTAITNNTFNGTYPGEIAWLKHWWASRLNFMDNQFTRPATASQPSGPVPAGSSITLTSPSLATTGVKIYYTTNDADPRPRATVTLAPGGGFTTIATMMSDIGTVRTIVPTSNATGAGPTAPNNTGTEWRGADLNGNGSNQDDFNDSTWFTNPAGTLNGVGYDDTVPAGTGTDYLPFISVRWNGTSFHNATVPAPVPLPVSPIATHTVMRSGFINGTNYAGNQSCYLRFPFTVTAGDLALAATAGNRLVLQMRHDDGFVAWINGTELTTARVNAPAIANLAFNSAASATFADTSAVQYTDYIITSFLSALHVGENVLAIHGLNSGLSSSDLIMGAKIIVQGPPPPFTPDLDPAAVEFTVPIVINAPTALYVRTVNPVRPSDPPTQSGGGTGSVPNGSNWSAPTVLYYFPGAVAASQASIQITEVHYHPPPPSPDEVLNGWTNSNDFEFIRLTNTGAAPVDLTGIYFSNGLEFTAVPGLQNWLPAGASVVVVENTAAFISRYGTSFTILGEFNGELDDGGEHIVLNDKTRAIISDFIYGDGSGPGDNWPAAPDNGYSLIHVSGDQNLPANWRVSHDPGGSAVTNFARWQRRYFADGDIPNQGMAADTDGDGLNNLGEYAAGTDPRTSGAAEQSIALAADSQPGRASFVRRAGTTDLTWIIESSTDPRASWTPIGGGPLSTVSNGNDTETLTYSAPGAPVGIRLFLRARVTSP